MEVLLRVCEANPRIVSVDRPEFVIGRAEDCDLTLTNPLVSRHHCVLTVRDGGVYVRDLESSNGTGLNNRLLRSPAPLHEGDTLWVAVTPIEIHIRQCPKVPSRGVAMLRKLRHPIPAMIGFQVPQDNLVTG